MVIAWTPAGNTVKISESVKISEADVRTPAGCRVKIPETDAWPPVDCTGNISEADVWTPVSHTRKILSPVYAPTRTT